jgi:ABC-type uncharacterized transport system permease subunit
MFPASGRAAQSIGFVLAVVVLLAMVRKKKSPAAAGQN